MSKVESFVAVAMFNIERQAVTPLYQQLYHTIREAILTGRLPGGTRLPSSRALATDLAVSRNTVVNAFEKLMAEGYLEGKIGAGTYVTTALPEEMLQVQPITIPQPKMIAGNSGMLLSQRGQQLTQIKDDTRYPAHQVEPFRPGIPALDKFPFKVWEKLWLKRWRNLSQVHMVYGQEAGYPPLRQAIADYLRTARGVNCTADQVVIVSGAQQAIDLTVRILLDPGDTVWLEDPGYLGTRGSLVGAEANIIPIPVDEDGLAVEIGIQQAPQARLAYVTPSHQYPLGVTMSLARRLCLLQWANQQGAWIIEDDYDSEYRYIGYPLASLQGLDQANRVIYVGTFSKVLFPALRLGYMVVPSALIEPFTQAIGLISRGVPTIDQAVLTDFITQGDFARHIRRMRTLYAERQTVFLETVQQELAGLLDIKAASAGLHVFGWLSEGIDDCHISQQLAEVGIVAPAYSHYTLQMGNRGGLVLGYAALNERVIRAGVAKMAQVLQRTP